MSKISAYSFLTNPTVNDYMVGNQNLGSTYRIKIGDIINNKFNTEPYKFGVYQNASGTSLPNNAWTKIHLDTKEYDTGTNFDATTNFRFTPPINGYYKFTGLVTLLVLATTHVAVSVYKNGVALKNGSELPSPNASTNCAALVETPLVYLTTSDYIELWAFQSQGSSASIINGSMTTYFGGFLHSIA